MKTDGWPDVADGARGIARPGVLQSMHAPYTAFRLCLRICQRAILQPLMCLSYALSGLLLMCARRKLQ